MGIIVVLMITNIATLLFWDKNEKVEVKTGSENEEKITTKESVAEVGNKEIFYEDWIQSLRENYGKKHLKEMIDKELVKQIAADRNIEINDKLIEKDIAYLTTMQGALPKSELEKEKEKWYEEVLYRYQLEEILVGDIDIPDEEAANYFNIYKNQYDFSASMQLSHIIVDTFEEAEKVINELDDEASFHLLAQEYSIDEETKDNGGYLGFYPETSQFIPHNYFEIAKDMDDYSYSEPFQSDQGVVIIYLHQKLPSITFTFDEVKQHVKNELALSDLEQQLTTETLWKQNDVKWIYEN